MSGRDRKAEGTVVKLDARELAVPSGQVARCAGGARFRMNRSQRELVQSVLEAAYELVEPAFVCSVHEVAGFLEDGSIELRNRSTFPAPPGERDPGMRCLAPCVCTIGANLEEAVRLLISSGETLEGLFLDAAGVAFLEALGAKAYETLRERAHEKSFRSGCRFVPGCGEVDLCVQKRIFELVDASSVGVRLNDACAMVPGKSVSFFTVWTTSQTRGNLRKCDACNLAGCPYRV